MKSSLRIRAVYVGINYRYLNPTPSHIAPMLARVFDMRFYGPGFVSETTLARGLDAFIKGQGGVDVIFVTKDFASGYPLERFGRFMSRYASMLNGGTLTASTLKDVRASLIRNRDRVVCFLTDLDPHAVPQMDLDNFRLHAKYFVLWGKQFLNTLGDAEWAGVEGHLQRKLKMGHKLGLLDNFAVEEHERIINIGFFVSEPEFFWGGLINRPFDVAVPGTAYARRKHFLDALARQSGRRRPNFNYRYFWKLADRTPIRPYANFYLLHMYNLLFQRKLSQTRLCITDGGANNYPVRKFFEISAAGSVLGCPPTNGMEALGYRNRVTCIGVRTAEEAVELAHAVGSQPEQFETIAAAGREITFAHHTLTARSEQIDAAVRRIIDTTFAGSYWKDGKFHLEERV